MSELLNDPAQLPSYRDLIGVIPTVSAVPTWVPRNVAEQVVIYNATLYVYDTSTGTWNTVGGASVGADTQVIFNDGGSISGNVDLTFSKASPTLAVGADNGFGEVDLGDYAKVYGYLGGAYFEGVGNGTAMTVKATMGTSNNGPGGDVEIVAGMGSITGNGAGGDITLTPGQGTGTATWGATLLSRQYYSPLNDIGNSGSSKTIYWYEGNRQLITLTAAPVTLTFSQPKDGAMYTLVIVQDGTGSRTITWPTIKWAGGAAPTLTAAASSVDIVSLLYANGSYYGTVSNNFY